MHLLGILAYGSIISDPGAEISAAALGSPVRVETDFRIEFARKSTGRGGAPTLAPVARGGASVFGGVFLLRPEIALEAAKDILFRRECNAVGTGRRYDPSQVKWMTIRESTCYPDVATLLYAHMCADIEGATAERLAELAIKSVSANEPGKPRRDGIQYLIDAKQNGITTPLMPSYEAALLQKLGVRTLQEALAATCSPLMK